MKYHKIALVERATNEEVDDLAKFRAFPHLKEGRWIQVETIVSSALSRLQCNIISLELDDWRMTIKRYILEGEEPKEPFERRKLKKQSGTLLGDRGRII